MNIKDMPTNYPLKSDHVVSSRDHISLVGVSPDNYRITRISAENWFHRIVHRTAEVGRDLLSCSSPASFSMQDALLQRYTEKKNSLPIKKKIQLLI